MNFTIYSIGDSEFLEQVLIAIAMLGGVGDFAQMTKIGLGIGVLATMLSAIAKGGREIEIQHVLIGYLLWATMFIPTARVQVEDTYTGDIRVIDNVPIGPAAAGGARRGAPVRDAPRGGQGGRWRTASRGRRTGPGATRRGPRLLR